MDDADRHPGAGHSDDAAPDPAGDIEAPQSGDGEIEDTLIEEASAIIDDARTYAEAEIAFQKTRAKLAGRLVGASAGLVIVALILLHIALLALAVGLVIALEPVVTIWGAIAIVVGGLLLITGLLGWMAMKRAKKLSALFSSSEKIEDQ
ncbi:hypothetical protein NAP1_04960 [Erythrobacter sp. NAP1]|uniref:phage holin family protein n=1 Tax=Erythrobacter sp. NAP1 TaxID=237727 RepID=UPI0000686ED5|nr:phage holin family protein [Erythrobacter sp. NAP1]EAQ30098.1 hypothetical protein NAP1_04960 [Erythrobacter sp. NAP1]